MVTSIVIAIAACIWLFISWSSHFFISSFFVCPFYARHYYLSLMQLLSATTLVGGAFCFGAFCFRSMYAFLALFAIGELLVFATQVNYCFKANKSLLIPLKRHLIDKKLLEYLLFPLQGPVNFICLHCVKPSLRPLSMAISTVSIHIFGDVPSAPLVGVLEVSLCHFCCHTGKCRY